MKCFILNIDDPTEKYEIQIERAHETLSRFDSITYLDYLNDKAYLFRIEDKRLYYYNVEREHYAVFLCTKERNMDFKFDIDT